jgi:hypothetical protein
VKLHKHVLERTKIFLHEYSAYRRDIVKHDAKWLEKNLKVEIVRSLALRRSLKGHNQIHTEKRSAAGAMTRNGWVLYISAESKTDMYQVGQAICQHILTRPSQQAYFFFEPFLTLDLYGLRARGYNVDRILRAKAAEARIADEERRQALEAEQQRIKEHEQQWSQQAKAAEAARQAAMTPEPTPSMPGSFGNDSPEESHRLPPPQQSKRGTGLFSNLSRRLGFENNPSSSHQDESEHLQKFIDNKPAHDDAKPPVNTGGGSSSGADDGRVTNPATVHQNLLNAIQSTRSHDSNHLFSPPTVNEVKEQATYCDRTPAANISFIAEAANGVKVFVAKDMAKDGSKFLSANIGAINAFAALLVEVGSVYSLSPKVIHVFHDQAGGTIAFNSSGSIFCNLRFFLQLHAKRLEGPAGAAQAEAKSEAAIWWWVVLAHELAHNLVQPHNSDHSYYT